MILMIYHSNRAALQLYCNAYKNNQPECKFFKLKPKTKYRCIYYYSCGAHCSNPLAKFNRLFTALIHYSKTYKLTIEDLSLDD